MRMRVFHLGLLVNELIQKLTSAVRRAGLDVSLGHRERLTESPAVRRRHDDQAGAGRPFDHREPLVGRKSGLVCHRASLLSSNRTTADACRVQIAAMQAQISCTAEWYYTRTSLTIARAGETRSPFRSAGTAALTRPH